MHAGYQDSLLIAGMGKTGKSVAQYMSTVGADYACCDDFDDYPGCAGALSGFSGFVIKSPGIPSYIYSGKPGVKIINDVELFMRLTQKPAILVTGTNGKSTVVALVEHILKAAGVSAMACGNYGIPVLDAYRKNAGVYIVELSSYQLEDMETLSCAASVVLNVGVDHVERYRDQHEYLCVKQKIYTRSSVSVYPVGLSGEVEYSGELAGYVATSDTEDNSYIHDNGNILRNNKMFTSVEKLSISGKHNYLNACAALSLLDRFNIDRDVVKHALNTFSGLPHRMELVFENTAGRKWINDSKSTNVHSLRAALSAQDKPVCLLAGGRGKGEDYSEVFNEFAHMIECLVTYGQDGAVLAGQARSVEDVQMVQTLAEAVDAADNCAADVLLSPACASFDQYRDYIERGEDFRNQVKRRAMQ